MALRQDLYELIQSLNQGDGRTVTTSNALSEQKQKLFHTLKKMKTYDQTALAQAFPGLPGSHLSVLKKQLYFQLLEILTALPSTQPQPLLSTRFAEIDFLSRRGLFLQAHTHIALTIAEAKDLEAFEPLKRLYPLKWELEDTLSALLPSPDREAEEQHFEEVLDAIAQDLELTRIYNALRAIRKLPHGQRLAAVQNTQQDLGSIDAFPALRNQITKFRAEYLAARIIGDFEFAGKVSRNIFELLLKNKKLLADPEARDWFLNSAKNHIAIQIFQRNFKEAEVQLQRFTSAAKAIGTQESNDIGFKAVTVFLRFAFVLRKKNQPEGIRLVTELKKILLDETNSAKAYQFIKSVNIALEFCFVYELYEDLLILVSQFMAGGMHLLSPLEIFAANQIYKLATRLNLQDFDTLEAEVLTVTSSFIKRGAWSEFERLMMAFFNEVCKNSLPQNIRKLMVALQTDLQNLFQNPVYWKYRDAFPAALWIQAYLEQKSMLTLFLSSNPPPSNNRA